MKKAKILPYIILFVACLYLVLPLAVTVIYSFVTGWTEILPDGFTIKYYLQLFDDRRFWPSMFRGIIISIIPILISSTVVILALYTSILYCPKLDRLIQGICMLPNILKGIVLAIPVLSLYAGSDSFLGNRIVMLTFVYCIVILPFVYQGIRNNLRAVNVVQLIEAAQMLGAGKLYAFIKVVVPNMLSGIMVSSLLSMSAIFGDFAIVKIIAGSKYITAQQLLYNSKNLLLQYQSAIVSIMFVSTLLISGAAFAYQNYKTKKDMQ